MVVCSLLAQTAGCSGEAEIGFSPLRSATSVVVNNARGAFRPETVRDPRTVARLIDLMNSNRHSWSPHPRFAPGSAPTCAYGLGFYDKQKWLAGISIESNGTTVSRSQAELGAMIAYKSNTKMGSEMLGVLHKKLQPTHSPEMPATRIATQRR